MTQGGSRRVWVLAGVGAVAFVALAAGAVYVGGQLRKQAASPPSGPDASASAPAVAPAGTVTPPDPGSKLGAVLRLIAAGKATMLDCRPFAQEVGDHQMRQLAQSPGLGELRDLNVDGTQVTDAGLAALPWFPNLRSFSASRTQITDAGLAHLAKIGPLEGLRFDDGRVTDAGLRHVVAITTLKSVSLYKCPITDRGLAELAKLPRLTELSLDETKVTGDGVKRAVPEMRELRKIKVWRTKVTADDAKEVQALRDGLAVVR